MDLADLIVKMVKASLFKRGLNIVLFAEFDFDIIMGQLVDNKIANCLAIFVYCCLHN